MTDKVPEMVNGWEKTREVNDQIVWVDTEKYRGAIDVAKMQDLERWEIEYEGLFCGQKPATISVGITDDKDEAIEKALEWMKQNPPRSLERKKQKLDKEV